MCCRDFLDYVFMIVYLGFEGDDYELELIYNYDYGFYVVGDGFVYIVFSIFDFEVFY